MVEELQISRKEKPETNKKKQIKEGDSHHVLFLNL